MKLYIKQKIFSLRDFFNVYDENKEVVYTVKNQVFSYVKKFKVLNSNKELLFIIKRKMFSFLPAYRIIQEGKTLAIIKKKFTFFKKDFILKTFYQDYKIEGDFLAFDFKILLNNEIKAHIHKKYFSIGDSYELDIKEGEDMSFYVGILIAIDNCLHDGR